VEDQADAIVSALLDDRDTARIFNVGEADALTEADWVGAIGQAAGWRGEVVAVPGDLLPDRLRKPLNYQQHLVYDTSRIREELGYREGLSREEALRRTVDWERSHPPDRIDPLDFDYAAEGATLAIVGART
jgi:nucleoside-diphosphate-sugar epimerase